MGAARANRTHCPEVTVNMGKPQSERLQKVMAHAGIASRRRSEDIIQAGRVTVNGEVVTELGTKVNPERDLIAVDGTPIHVDSAHTYIMLYKPAGVISTVDDPRGRATVRELVDVDARVYPAGRLDLDSEGLVLLTDDGELTYRLTHPSYEHQKEYHVLVAGHPTQSALERLRSGIRLEDGVHGSEPTAPAEVDVLRQEKDGTWLRVVLHEGRKRQIRRMADTVGHPVKRLIRVRLGTLRLGSLGPGVWRHLSRQEIDELRASVL
jgi:23S rRNA pseudouridine2605 synthase